MKICKVVTVATLFAAAGVSAAQPTIDGVFDPVNEGQFYSDILWFNNVPTGFGDNQAGDFTGGNFGNPEVVDTGIEIRVPLGALGLSGSETIRISGWVISGDRTFKSNQIIGSLPIDTPNIGGPVDFNNPPFDTTQQFVTVNLGSLPTGTPALDGQLDGGVAGSNYQRVFLQTNYTAFGNMTAGTVDGSGDGSGGSEINAVYMAKDATNLYIFVAGNLETNGNAIDIYLDTGPGGSSTLSGGSGAGGFIPGGQAGQVFDSGFAANYLLSVDTFNDDGDPGTINVPRVFFGNLSSQILLAGNISGYGAAGAGTLTNGDGQAPSIGLGVDNSNTEGVLGEPASPTPIAPDADWAYGSELNNIRSYIDTVNNRLYVFIGGNIEANYNKLQLFFDSRPGGQNILRDDNVDISFNGLNSNAGIRFDDGFSANYWLNINNGVDGGTNQLQRFADAAVLRTNGANIDPFFGVITDYGSFYGGPVASTPVLLFDGPRVDIQDGSLGSLFANYGPRLTADNPMAPIPNLIEVAINNSNVGGVTSDAADPAAVQAVNTGIEISIDLDELGWDGQQDILIAGWIANAGFDFVSNQVLGGLPDGSPNIGPRDSNGDGINDLDFSQIPGQQFVNLSQPPVVDCIADFNNDGQVNFFDVSAFIAAFNNQDPAADINGDGLWNFFDVSAFITLFNQGCP
ncbi:MAG: hypothetical protein LAT64_08010 [Phycisphaerales bacterium]|nr:hypothetical protein [Planctomycetota bacterium]MCH8508699.1 hypothetical protein [Phycisphaerales bacterium]